MPNYESTQIPAGAQPDPQRFPDRMTSMSRDYPIHLGPKINIPNSKSVSAANSLPIERQSFGSLLTKKDTIGKPVAMVLPRGQTNGFGREHHSSSSSLKQIPLGNGEGGVLVRRDPATSFRPEIRLPALNAMRPQIPQGEAIGALRGDQRLRLPGR